MANWAEARKQAEHISTFLRKLRDAEEIFVKAAQAENAIPELEKMLESAEDKAHDRHMEAAKLKGESENSIKQMHKEYAEANDQVDMVESRLRELTVFYDTQVEEEKERASKAINDMKRRVKKVADESMVEVKRLKDEVDMWKNKLKDAANAHQVFVKSVTS